MKSAQQQLLRWCFWFFFFNACLVWLISLNYYPNFFPVSLTLFTKTGIEFLAFFLFFSYIGQFGLLVFMPGCVLIIFSLIFPKRFWIVLLAIVIATTTVMLIIADSFVYNLFRFHINGIVMNLVMNGVGNEAFGFSSHEWLIGLAILCGLLSIELLSAWWLWRVIIAKDRWLGWGKWIIIFISTCAYLSYSMIVFSADSMTHRFLIMGARFLPLYEDFLGLLLPSKNGKIALQRTQERYFIQPPQATGILHYPNHPLQFKKQPPLNIVIIGIDAWRFDMLNKQVMPYLAEFAKNAWVFSQHSSGGNSTGPGIFSLFYSVPSTYWTAMETEHQSPLLIEQLIKRHYQLGIFASGTLQMPDFQHTIFQALKNLQLEAEGATPYSRDQKITQEFSEFIMQARKKNQPFFSYLFYDSAHGYCSVDEALAPFKPAVAVCNRYSLTNQSDPAPYFNRYKNALRLVDAQIQTVIKTLRDQHLLTNTIIIITGDHGEEFNDNHLNYWGHAGNFTQYQVQTPLVVYWPGKKPAFFTHQTSHYDVVPTLMQDVFGCQNNPQDYSIGKNLLDTTTRDYLIVGSYIAFGVIEPNQITNIYSTGNFSIINSHGQTQPEKKLNVSLMQKVFKETRHFYQAEKE